MNYPLFIFGLSVIVAGLIVALKLRKWHFSTKNPRPRPLKLATPQHEEREDFDQIEHPEEDYPDSSDSDLVEFELDEDEK